MVVVVLSFCTVLKGLTSFRRILLFPNGNTTDRDVACFLDSEDSHDSLLDPSWHVCVNFSLVFRNVHGTNSTSPFCRYPHISTLRCTQQISTKAARHRFSRSENDWGFNNIVPISELRGTGRGPNSKPPLLIDDKIIIAAYLRGYKDENGVLWHKFDK